MSLISSKNNIAKLTLALVVGGGITATLAYVIGSERKLQQCNSGDVAFCQDVPKTMQKRITNNDWLAMPVIKVAEKCLEFVSWCGDDLSGLDLSLLPNELKTRLDIRVEQIAKDKEKAEIKAKAEAKRLAAERAERATWGDWSYDQFTDDATGKSYKRASVRSENSINLGFPYSGTQYGTLYLRQHPRWGFDAFVAIRQGQILCGNYKNTSVLIRFDEGPAVKYRCNEPADLSSETVFIRDAQNFEVGLKRAQKAYITLNLYQGGQKTFIFKVKGYDSGKV